MDVFHYCAEYLKGTPLFETCSDDHILRPRADTEGAIYNDFDGNNAKLVENGDFENWLRITENVSSDSEEEQQNQELSVPIVSEEDIDYYFLESDAANPLRWTKDHHLFSANKEDGCYQSNINFLASMSEKRWQELPITAMDLERYF